MCRAVLIAAIAVTPLALMSEVFLSHDVIPKVLLILTGAACVLFLSKEWIPGRGPFLYLVAAQAMSLALSTAFSSQRALSLVGATWRRFGFVEQLATLVIACGAAAIARPSWTRRLLRAMTVCGGIGAIYGIAQYFGIDPFLDPDLYTIQFLGGVVRPPATMGHAIYFAAYLVPIALLAASTAGTEDPPWKRLEWLVCLLAVAAILLSGSRAAVLAAGAGGLMLARRTFVRLAVAAFVLAGVAALFLISPVRLRQWYEDPGGTRLGVWRDSPTLILHHSLLGTGPETFAKEFRAIESVELSRAYPDFYHETPHNAFIDAACAQGIPGALILAAVFALGLYAPRGELNEQQRGLQAALAGLLITSLFASLTLVTSMLIWTLAGLRARSAVVERPPQAARIAGLAFVAAAIVLGVQDRSYALLQDAVDERNLVAASNAFSVATGFPPGLPGYELWSSREFASLGRPAKNSPAIPEAWAKAAEAADLAEKQGEEPFTAAYQVSVLAVASGDLARAETAARETIRLAPNWYKPHLLLGQILQAAGRGEEAMREFQQSRNLGWKGVE